MGLLDEAIREHLELKRQQGADPDEIARSEREALEPVLPDEPATWGTDHAPVLDGVPDTESGVPMLEDSAPDGEVAMPEAASSVDFSTVGQETMEIDMREVLGEDGAAFMDSYPVDRVSAAPVRAGRITRPDAVVRDDELEWEVAGHVSGESTQGIPGQERLAFE